LRIPADHLFFILDPRQTSQDSEKGGNHLHGVLGKRPERGKSIENTEGNERKAGKMTEKAKKILNKLKVTRLFQSPEIRDRALSDFNQSKLDPVGPIGNQDQSMRVLNEMNELGQQEEQAFRDSAAKISIC
jgi:hypothetical protein